MWLDEFKIALIRKETQTLERLISEMPPLTDKSEMKEAAFLLHQAGVLFIDLQEETARSLLQLKKSSDFLRSSQTETPSRLDITL